MSLTGELDKKESLFIPEELHAAARSFFVGHLAANTGPAYLCPYIDPRWDMARIQAAVAAVPPTPTMSYGRLRPLRRPHRRR